MTVWTKQTKSVDTFLNHPQPRNRSTLATGCSFPIQQHGAGTTGSLTNVTINDIDSSSIQSVSGSSQFKTSLEIYNLKLQPLEQSKLTAASYFISSSSGCPVRNPAQTSIAGPVQEILNEEAVLSTDPRPQGVATRLQAAAQASNIWLERTCVSDIFS